MAATGKVGGRSPLTSVSSGWLQDSDEIRPVGSFHARRHPQMWAMRGDVGVTDCSRETDMTFTCVAQVSGGVGLEKRSKCEER